MNIYQSNTKLEKYITDNIAKLNIEDYLDANTETLKKIVQQNAIKLNQQMNRLLSYGAETGKISNEAYESVEQSGGLFSTVSPDPTRIHMTRNELLHELAREIYTANLKTFTLSGAYETRKNNLSAIEHSTDYKDFKEKYPDASIEDFYNSITGKDETTYTEDFIDYWDEHENYNKLTAQQNYIISKYWENFHKYLEEHPNLESKRALEYYEKAGTDITKFNKLIREDQQEKERKQQEVIENVTKQTGYQPKWEF